MGFKVDVNFEGALLPYDPLIWKDTVPLPVTMTLRGITLKPQIP
jgi:hypothetical protein